MSKFTDIKQMLDLTQDEKIKLTNSINYTRENSPGGNGYVLKNVDTGVTIWSPNSVDGISGIDLLDFNILRLLP